MQFCTAVTELIRQGPNDFLAIALKIMPYMKRLFVSA